MTDAEQALAATIADLRARIERLECILSPPRPRDSTELYPKLAREK